MSNKLERLLRETGRRLAEHQIARFYKIPEEMTVTPCDFIGFTASGRAILIEAKMVTRMSLPIGTSNGLQPHQWNALLEANRANCISLLCWAQGGVCATMTVDMVLELSKGRKSIPWEQIDERFLHSMSGSQASLRILEPFLGVKNAPTNS